MNLVTGMPKSGTGFAAEILSWVGFDVRHEAIGRHGTSDWTMAPEWEEHRTFWIVRDPVKVARSLLATSSENWARLGWMYGPLSGDRPRDGILAWGRCYRMALKSMRPIFKLEDLAQSFRWAPPVNTSKERGITPPESPTADDLKRDANAYEVASILGYVS